MGALLQDEIDNVDIKETDMYIFHFYRLGFTTHRPLYRILSSLNLRGQIPNTIGSFLNLTRLYIFPLIPFTCIYSPFSSDLSHNQLSGTIPLSIGNLVDLQALYVSYILNYVLNSIYDSN